MTKPVLMFAKLAFPLAVIFSVVIFSQLLARQYGLFDYQYYLFSCTFFPLVYWVIFRPDWRGLLKALMFTFSVSVLICVYFLDPEYRRITSLLALAKWPIAFVVLAFSVYAISKVTQQETKMLRFGKTSTDVAFNKVLATLAVPEIVSNLLGREWRMLWVILVGCRLVEDFDKNRAQRTYKLQAGYGSPLLIGCLVVTVLLLITSVEYLTGWFMYGVVASIIYAAWMFYTDVFRINRYGISIVDTNLVFNLGINGSVEIPIQTCLAHRDIIRSGTYNICRLAKPNVLFSNEDATITISASLSEAELSGLKEEIDKLRIRSYG